MNNTDKAKELVQTFGKALAIKVVDEIYKRDESWIEKLSAEHPKDWKPSDIMKSAKMCMELKSEILKLQ